MNKIVAVSGGVDSVVLLDILAGAQLDSLASDQQVAEGQPPLRGLIVAHVDHGIRGEESAADARFVKTLAKSYRLPCVQTSLGLDSTASEEEARSARYGFLFELAEKHRATIVTAHHQDDVLGSIAINIQRGTGWRGLAVMGRVNVERPLIGWTKQAIYDYALKQRLEWVEDATNASDSYLRNRLRELLRRLDRDAERQLVAMRQRQLQLRRDIDREIERLAVQFADRRYPYIQIEPRIATEILRHQYGLTYPQAKRVLHAIKVGRAGTTHDVAGGAVIKLQRQQFVVASHLE